MKKSLLANKIREYVIEPIRKGPSAKWEGHHTTNPCVIRLSKDPRVFLGYRAGGDDDFYMLNEHRVWGSHLGMAVMDPRGERIIHRLPLPIMKKVHDLKLPKSAAEYAEYQKKYKDCITVYHDFRFWEYRDYLYVIYHEGPLHECYDCIVRMPLNLFLDKINESIRLMESAVEAIENDWARLWWQERVWEPCGVNGTNRVFASHVNKGDDVFILLGDGSLQLCHRPLADGMAVLNTGQDTFARATADGLTTYGCYEVNVRPGYIDNSHLGANGSPIRARIGDVDVYIDVTHGCHDRMISNPEINERRISYLPYFRVKDFETGELLYYSEEPILHMDEIWREYVEEGEWVSNLPHLDGVMFAGGQIETVQGENGLDNPFITYLGVGDTAVARAVFRLRDLLPDQVIEDIQTRKRHQKVTAAGIAENEYPLGGVNGWQWSIRTDPARRMILVTRRLEKDGWRESTDRPINSRPGHFDSDGLIFDGKSIKELGKTGWGLIYRGFRWEEREHTKRTHSGYGILVLDRNNPEKVLYRSTQPIEGSLGEEGGWTAAHNCPVKEEWLLNLESLIPPKVLFEMNRMKELEKQGKGFNLQMISWQRQKSGLLEKESRVFI